MTMNRGYIKLWRKFKDTAFFRDPLAAHLAVYLLLEANHEPKELLIGSDMLKIDRGQVLTSLGRISEETGLSLQQTRTMLVRLNKTGFLCQKSTNKYSLIFIDKYDEYQGGVNTQSTCSQHAINTQSTTNKNYKNYKNYKNIYSDTGVANSPDTTNWDNCKTESQRFVAGYVKRYLPELVSNGTKAQVQAFYKRHARAVKSIIDQSGDNHGLALAACDLFAADMAKSGLTWTLDTLAKNFMDYYGPAIKKIEASGVARKCVLSDFNAKGHADIPEAPF